MTKPDRAVPVRGGPDVGVLDEIIRRVVEVAQPDRSILFGSAAREELGSREGEECSTRWRLGISPFGEKVETEASR